MDIVKLTSSYGFARVTPWATIATSPAEKDAVKIKGRTCWHNINKTSNINNVIIYSENQCENQYMKMSTQK